MVPGETLPTKVEQYLLTSDAGEAIFTHFVCSFTSIYLLLKVDNVLLQSCTLIPPQAISSPTPPTLYLEAVLLSQSINALSPIFLM